MSHGRYLRASRTYREKHWTRTEIEMSNFQLQQFNPLPGQAAKPEKTSTTFSVDSAVVLT